MRRAFRPSMTEVEPRRLLSGAAPEAAFVGSGAYAYDYRLGLHEQYLAEAQRGPTRLVFLGDSLTYFWGEPDRPDLGSGWWDARFAPLGARNFGIAGDRTENVLWRVENGELAGQPKVAVVLVGVNDLLSGRAAAATARHIGDVARTINKLSPETEVLVVGVLPTANPILNRKIDRVNALLGRKNLGSRVTVEDVSRSLLKPNGDAREAIYSMGGIHLNASGYTLLGRALLPTVKRLLRSR